MTGEDLFDFELDDESGNEVRIDSEQEVNDTNTKPKAPAKRRSGKTSGKKSGSVTRQQKRVPMHERMPLTADSRPGWVRRVVNDVPGRVDRLKLAGWTVVEDGTAIGDTYAGQASGMGSSSTKPVGRGISGILMEIPQEIYDEDQAAKQQKIDEDEKAMMVESADNMHDASGTWQGEIKMQG